MGASRVKNALTDRDYFEAAQDYATALDAMHVRGEYALCIFVSGLVVECLLRAYRGRRGLPFTSEHKLGRLADESRLADLVPERHRAQFDSALTDLAVAWDNSHRLRSNEALRRYLKKARLDRGIRGDYLRVNSRRLMSRALILLSLGIKRWNR